MAQYFTDFTEYTPDQSPHDWTERFSGGAGIVRGSSLPAGATNGRALEATTLRYSWDKPGTPSGDVEVVAKLLHTFPSTNALRVFLHGAEGAGSPPATNYYFTGQGPGSGTPHTLEKFVEGTVSTLGTAAFTHKANTWYIIRLQRTGTTIRAKIWQSGSPEPESWLLSSTDNSLSSGFVGLFNTAYGTQWCDWFGVGTNGDPAPMEPPNTAPTITVAPNVSYGALTRLGPNNSPAIVSFTAADADGDPLTYEIRTGASGGGTLVGDGTCTSGVSKQHNIEWNDPGISEGTYNLYLRVHDGTAYSTDSAFEIDVDYTQGVPAALLGAAGALYAPALIPGAVAVPAALHAAGAIYGATLSPGAVALAAAMLEQGGNLYAADLTTGRPLAAALLSGDGTLYGGAVHPGSVALPVGFLTAGGALYGGVVVGRSAVAAAFLPATGLLPGGAVAAGAYRLEAAELVAAGALYGSELESGALAFPAAFLPATGTLSGGGLSPGAVPLSAAMLGPIGLLWARGVYLRLRLGGELRAQGAAPELRNQNATLQVRARREHRELRGRL